MKLFKVFIVSVFVVAIVSIYMSASKTKVNTNIDPSSLFVELRSEKGEIIRINKKIEDKIKSPLELSGQVRGAWSFEGDFPVILTNWNGLIIAETYATVEGDWMTTDYVPFKVIINFDKPDFDERGYLIFKKNNPSGLPENDDSLEISVFFE